MQNLKYNTREPIYELESNAENRRVVAEGREGGIGSLGLAEANCYTQHG